MGVQKSDSAPEAALRDEAKNPVLGAQSVFTSESASDVLQKRRDEVAAIVTKYREALLAVPSVQKALLNESLPGALSANPVDRKSITPRIVDRASNPYHNHRSPVRNLSLEPTALNCVLEALSGELMKSLATGHRDILQKCATNPTSFNPEAYSIIPYALGAGRWSGDLLISELTLPDKPCKALYYKGSAPRIPGVGADAPYGFLLMHGDSPIAAVSYVVCEGPSLFVVMTQRLRQDVGMSFDPLEIKLNEKAQRRLHIKETILSICSSIGAALGCSSITYQGAINNRWVHEMVPQGDDDGYSVPCVPRMRRKDAEETYDDFCKSHGFSLDPQSGNFFKRLV